MPNTPNAPEGLRGWIISDGKAGNEAQARGVFDALRLEYEVKHVAPSGVWRLLAPWGPVNPYERFGSKESPFRPPWPQFAVAAGRLTIPYLRTLKRRAGIATYTIILLDPKVDERAADLFWVPQHDKRRGPNVISTLTAPHSFTPQRLAELRRTFPPAIAALPRPRVAVALGGPNGDYRYSEPALLRLGTALQSLVALGAGLMITASRRTPGEAVSFLRDAMAAGGAFFWDGAGENPYPYFLAHADAFVVPADSINMTGEPCATGKPVYVFHPDGGSPKFDRFHQALVRYGATRPLPKRLQALDTWHYPPLISSEIIAAEITRRWTKRRQMLGTQPAASRA
jgi:uncharacterized protein